MIHHATVRGLVASLVRQEACTRRDARQEIDRCRQAHQRLVMAVVRLLEFLDPLSVADTWAAAPEASDGPYPAASSHSSGPPASPAGASLGPAPAPARDPHAVALADLRAAVAAALDGLRQDLPAAGVDLDGARGETFDPTRHRAICSAPSAGLPADAVTDVHQHGIVCLGRRLRRARVTRNSRSLP